MHNYSRYAGIWQDVLAGQLFNLIPTWQMGVLENGLTRFDFSGRGSDLGAVG
jgi:hypothetical protein